VSESAPEDEQEAVARVSPDLPYEIQSKLFEQLAAAGVAGAGLTITLVGTILKGSFLIWLATVEFTMAAVVALSGQTKLIEALAAGKPVWKVVRMITMIAMVLIGMGIGSLAMSVYLEGKTELPGGRADRALDRG
jgi:hypothetical protein